MNKKLLKSFAAAAMSVLALACAKEPVTGDGLSRPHSTLMCREWKSLPKDFRMPLR